MCVYLWLACGSPSVSQCYAGSPSSDRVVLGSAGWWRDAPGLRMSGGSAVGARVMTPLVERFTLLQMHHHHPHHHDVAGSIGLIGGPTGQVGLSLSLTLSLAGSIY